MDFDQLINFTRTSSATFVGSNGLIQNTPQSRNLLTWTQEFDNAAWEKAAMSVTANVTTAPDGTGTTDLAVPTAILVVHRVRQPILTIAGGVATYSIYVKANGYTKIALREGETSGASAAFDLSGSGSLIFDNSIGGATVSNSTITDAGNGWFRISATFTGPTSQRFDCVVLSPAYTSGSVAGTWTPDGTSGIFLWGAQLETGSTATDYTRNVGGLFPARFDYDPVTLAPRGILIEEQRTNLLLRSEEFDNAAWTKSNSTVTTNAVVAPDGASTGDQLIEDTATLSHGVTVGFSWVSGTTYTASVLVRAAGRNFFQIAFPGAQFNSAFANFDVSSGALGSSNSATATITSFGNGWYRCTATATATSSAFTSLGLLIQTSGTASRFGSYTGDGTSGLYIWGAQLEVGAFATSYIPTVASQVTRTADQASIVAPMFAPWYNQTEGTFVVEWDGFKPTTASGTPTVFQAGNATDTFIDAILAGGNYLARTFVGGVSQAEFSPAYVANVTEKFASAYKVNDFAFSRNGATALVDTSGNVPTDLDRIGIGITRTGTNVLNGHIRRLTYYPVRLTNAQLQELTA